MKKKKQAQKPQTNEIIWQPLSRLPLIAHIIDESVIDAENQQKLLIEGREKPHVFDDALVDRIKYLYIEKLQFIDIYFAQIERWKKETLTTDEDFELARLAKQCERLKPLVNSILALAEEIGTQTIDKILGMDDAELALKVLLGEITPPAEKASRTKRPARPSSQSGALPELTVNRRFIQDFVSAEAPCFALGLVEEHGHTHGFLALRPDQEIPPEVTGAGFDFGHCLRGNKDFEVIQFVFEFSGYKSYNVLVNPNNPIVQTVLSTMIDNADYFFFAMNPSGGVTAFRSELGEDNSAGLKTNLPRIQQSTTNDLQYRKALSQFEKNPQPEGILLDWVCRDDEQYLDLSKDRLELTPAR
jgi:hypothetical protein